MYNTFNTPNVANFSPYELVFCCIIFFCQLINIVVIALLKAVVEVMSDNREFFLDIIFFCQISRSLHQPFGIASDLLDISNPHEYADICY